MTLTKLSMKKLLTLAKCLFRIALCVIKVLFYTF